MKDYKTNQIRNVGLVSHGGAGKTTLTEAFLFNTKVIDRMGRVENGTTVSDYDPEEIARQISISTSVIPVEWRECKINILDMPGYFDFFGEVVSGLRVVDSVIIPVCAASGVEVGTEKVFNMAKKNKLPIIFFINKMDRENADYFKTLNQLMEKFGNKVIPLTFPIGSEQSFKGYVDVLTQKAYVYDEKGVKETEVPADLMDKVLSAKEELIENIAENDETLMEKYFGGEEFTQEEMKEGIKNSIRIGELMPVLCGSSLKNIGTDKLLDAIVEFLPSPLDIEREKASENGPVAAFVFKTIADPYVGRLSIFKVVSGTLTSDSTLLNSNKQMQEKISQLYILRGKKQMPVSKLVAGDIGAVAKLQYTMTGDTLCDPSKLVTLAPIDFPQPTLSLAIEPKSKGDEEKISNGLQRLQEEDPTFKVEKNLETGQMIVYGMGEQHIEVISKKLMNKFGVECTLTDPIVPYRETIKGKVKVEGKHKKQTGGHGQYGHVWIEFEPNPNSEFEFEDKIFGGAVPKQYIPAVEKGLRESMKEGVLARYPVVNIKATLVDGSYHPVDSSEMAFKIAASLAFKKGMEQANPVLLEPIMRVEVVVPEEYMGDIIGDLNKRRGRILGMESKDNLEVITAEVPLAEMNRYATDLRSLTQARGDFKMTFARYEEAPPNVAQKIIEERKKLKEKEE
ncbi:MULTISPECIES: elongation factor G [Thermoanaerobacter]|uniref:Elongation factor G n=2 Tax=Thermoanaerobacter TaxID=1754 RepID=B0KCG2_THEP3|nr:MULTISPECIES: elongation factor G [Thermoanaerobacter]ABY94005.1 translation elongation factor G [Thermoanaerobacter pseudethanolicus ATCC 33223]ADV78961.1 translation elongation factor G [Thermoanaerobacter brockii subsp. finnii Ako-1]HBW60192.1 elongation factor G [Thermoanaerobacter sp.]